MPDDKIHVEITTACKAEIIFEPYPYPVKVEQGDCLKAVLLPDGSVLSVDLSKGSLTLWCNAPPITLNGALEADLTWLPTPAPKYSIERVKATVTTDRPFEIRFDRDGYAQHIDKNDALTFYFAPSQELRFHFADGLLVIGCELLTIGGRPTSPAVSSDASSVPGAPPNVRAVREICLPFLEPKGHEPT